jgi:hypothetical protein
MWYNLFDSLERRIVNLTISLFDNIESLTLMKELKSILNKILESSKGDFIRYSENYGAKKAKNIVKIALSFGYSFASTWLYDSSFQRLLTLNEIYNAPR